MLANKIALRSRCRVCKNQVVTLESDPSHWIHMDHADHPAEAYDIHYTEKDNITSMSIVYTLISNQIFRDWWQSLTDEGRYDIYTTLMNEYG